MIDITLFEEEIINILKADADTIAAHTEITKDAVKLSAIETLRGLAHAGSYQGNINEILTSSILPFPSALVIYGGATIDNVEARQGAKGKVSVSISVFVIGNNLLGSGEASRDVRLFLTAVRTVLNGFEFRGRTLLWTSESLEMIANTGTCVYEQGYRFDDWMTT